MKRIKGINDYQTMLERLIAAAERPKPFATTKQKAFWAGQIKAYKLTLKYLHEFKGRIFPIDAGDGG